MGWHHNFWLFPFKNGVLAINYAALGFNMKNLLLNVNYGLIFDN